MLNSMAFMGAGAATQMVSAWSSARAQKDELEFNAQMAELNAQASERSAQQTLQAGNEEIAQTSLKYGALKSTQRAGLAASGVDLSVGSATEVQASTDLAKELDLNAIKVNAVRAAWGHRTQATNYRNQATMARGASSAISPGMAATTSLLGSASQIAGKYYDLDRAGAFDKSGPAVSGSGGLRIPLGASSVYGSLSTPQPQGLRGSLASSGNW